MLRLLPGRCYSQVSTRPDHMPEVVIRFRKKQKHNVALSDDSFVRYTNKPGATTIVLVLLPS